jgi:hypothetical protein
MLDATWTPRDWVSLDAGYSRLHIDTATWLSYFVAFRPVRGERSYYTSNLNVVHATAHLAVKEFATISLGYSRTQDKGADQLPAPEPFRSFQDYPMLYDSPSAQLSIRLHNKIRWNIGYQYYRYDEDLFASQNYRAHTGYTSILWTF